MHKRTITYNDHFGKPRTEDFYFHYSKTELMEMEMSTEGGYADRLMGIVKANSSTEIFFLMKKLLLGAYGVKSEDGRLFEKSEKIRYEFERCPAYDVLMQELCLGEDAHKKAAEFFNAIVPEGTAKADAPAAIPAVSAAT